MTGTFEPKDGSNTYKDQIAAFVQERLVGVPGTSGYFEMQTTDNSLRVQILPNISGSYVSYRISVDDNTFSGVSWTDEQLPPSVTAAAYGTQYVYNIQVNTASGGTGDTTNLIPSSNSDGSSPAGYLVTCSDTLAPDWTSATFAVSSDGSYSINPEPTDTGTGVQRYDIYDDDTGTPILIDVATTGSAGAISIASGTTRHFFCRAYDGASPTPNSSDSAVVTVTKAAPASYGGLISLSGGTAVDPGSNSQVTVSITGRTTDFGAVSVTLTTADHTAIAGTDYTALSAQTVTFPDNVNDPITVDITTLTPSPAAQDNNCFETWIDLDSATTGAEIDGVSSNDVSKYAVLNYINGAGIANSGIYEDYTYNTSYRMVVLDPDMTMDLITGVLGPYVKTTYAAAGITDESSSYANAPANILNWPYASGFTIGDWSTLPRARWSFYVATAGNYQVYVRSYNGASAFKKFLISIDGQVPNELDYMYTVDSSSSGNWVTNDWSKSSGLLSFSLSTGEHTIDILPGTYGSQMYYDRVWITNDTSFTMVNDGTHDFDDAISSEMALTDPVDNPDNPDNPQGGPTSDTITSTSKFTNYPANGADQVSPTVKPTLTLVGITGLKIKSASATLGGVAVVVDYSITSDLTTATFTLNGGAPLANSSDVVMTVNCSAIDDDSIRKDIVLGTWGFTTAAAAASGDVIFTQSNESIALGVLTNSVLTANYSVSGVSGTYCFAPSQHPEAFTIANDLTGGYRGKALTFNVPQGEYGGTGYSFYLRSKLSNSATDYDDIYSYFDFYLDPQLSSDTSFPHIVDKQFKLGGFFTYTGGDPSTVTNTGSADDGYSIRMSLFGPTSYSYVKDNSIPSGINANALCVGFLSHYSRTTQWGTPIWCRKTYESNVGSGAYIGLVPGAWNRVQIRTKVNTAGTANGILQVWINGYLALDVNNLMMCDATQGQLYTQYYWTELYHGGADNTFAAGANRYYQFDGITYSTSPIETVYRTPLQGPWDGTN